MDLVLAIPWAEIGSTVAIILVAWVLPISAGIWVANLRGHHPLIGFIFALVGSWIGVLILLLIPSKHPRLSERDVAEKLELASALETRLRVIKEHDASTALSLEEVRRVMEIADEALQALKDVAPRER